MIDTTKKESSVKDVYVSNGKIQKMGQDLNEDAEVIIDAEEKYVSPGFIDLHTHTREPGNEDAEDISSCSVAAVYGGFTAISPMPNTSPACDSQAQVRFVKEKQRGVRLYPVGAITVNREGKNLTEMSELKNAGVRAVSDDGSGVADPDLLRRAMEYASMFDLTVISHCEDPYLAAGGVMNEGVYSAKLGLAPLPSQAESVMVARDIQIAELTGCRLHIAHISASESVELVRRAKAKGVNVTAEATPHHFSLTDKEVSGYDSVYKVNPPLRSEKDVESVKEGLKDGTIDAIATDHAPHLKSSKEKEFDYAPFGMIGLQTALSASCEFLVHAGILSVEEMVEKLTKKPAEVLGLEGYPGKLEPGMTADITIFDPGKEWVYDAGSNVSRSENSPFLGRTMKGLVTYVLIDGQLFLNNGELA